MTRLRLEALYPDLTPAGIIAGWTTCDVIRRRNRLGTWTFTAPGDRIAREIRAALTAGGHVVVWDLDRPDLPPMSAGPLEAPVASWGRSDPWGGSVTVSGVDDLYLLEDRETYPDPTAASTAQTLTAYDVRSGAGETVLKGYVDANTGTAARAERRVPGVTVAASLGRGGPAPEQSRWENLLEVAQRVAEKAGLVFTIDRDGVGGRVFDVRVPVVQEDVLLSSSNGSITDGESGLTAPTATRAIMLGKGEGTARTVREVTTALSLAAEVEWGRRIERSVDRRDADDPAILDADGAEELAGATASGALSVTIADTALVQWRKQYEIGDFLPWVYRGVEQLDAVQEVKVSATPETTRVAPTLGPNVPITGPNADMYARLRRLERLVHELSSRQ